MKKRVLEDNFFFHKLELKLCCCKKKKSSRVKDILKDDPNIFIFIYIICEIMLVTTYCLKTKIV